MTHLPRFVLPASALLLMAARAGLAAACEDDPPPVVQLLPRPDGTVPSNVVLIAAGSRGRSPAIELQAATGVPVSLTIACEGAAPKSGMAEVCIARPEARLEAGSYTWSSDGLDGAGQRAQFAVADAVDDEPPAPTAWSLVAEADSVDGSCDSGNNDIVRFEFVIEQMPDDAVFIAKPSDSDAVYGVSSTASFKSEAFESWLGDNADSGCLDARLIDVAGNTTELDQACYETASSCGCRLVGAGSRGGLAFAGLVLALWLLRRRVTVAIGGGYRSHPKHVLEL